MLKGYGVTRRNIFLDYLGKHVVNMKERYYFEDDCIYDDVAAKLLVDFHDTDMYNMKSLLRRLNDYEKQLKEKDEEIENKLYEYADSMSELRRENIEQRNIILKLRKEQE